MLDWWLERQIDWHQALNVQSQHALEDIWDRIESLRSPIPLVEQLETTNCCPMTCIMCPRGLGHMTRKVGHMNNDLFRAVCLQIEEGWQALKGSSRDPALYPDAEPASYIEAVGLRLHHFGSPLMDPYFIERVIWIKQNCTFPIHASISAEHLRGDNAWRLVDSGIDRVIIALDGTSDNEYKAVRGAAADYGLAISGIDALLNAKAALDVPIQLDVQLVDVWDDPMLRARFYTIWSDVDGLSVNIKRVFGYPDINGEAIMGRKWIGPCAWPFLSIVVTVDGSAVLCCADYDVEIVLGNVRERSLLEIWNSARYRDVRHKFLFAHASTDSLCGRCAFYGR